MSDQIAQPGNGADPAGGTHSAEPTGQAQTTGATPSGGDYFAKIDSDPEFRRTELTKHQGRADRAEAQLRQFSEKLGPLSDYIEQGVSGNVIAQVVQEYQALAKDPNIAQAIESYRQHGEVSLPGAKPKSEDNSVDDDYLTDTERQLKSELESTKSLLSELRNQVTQTNLNVGTQSLQRHLEDVYTQYGIEGEDAEKVRDQLTKQVQQWRNQGETGANALRNLQTSEGRGTVELLVSKALGMDGLLRLAEKRALREGKLRSGMATDSPSAFGSTGEDESDREEFGSVEEAIRAARARPERLGRY